MDLAKMQVPLITFIALLSIQPQPAQGLLWILDHIPQISQWKSFFQLLTLDWESARRTQHNFVTGPIMAHLIPIVIDEVRTRTSGEPAGLQFKAGDVIFCRVNGPIYQVMLATTNSTVAYVKPKSVNETDDGTGVRDNSTTGAILREEPWNLVVEEYTQGCFIDSLFCSKWSVFTRSSRWCRFSAVKAVEHARKEISARGAEGVYYDQFYCNCEHWVSFWYRGYGYSGQAYLAGKDGRTSLWCPIKKFALPLP